MEGLDVDNISARTRPDQSPLLPPDVREWLSDMSTWVSSIRVRIE